MSHRPELVVLTGCVVTCQLLLACWVGCREPSPVPGLGPYGLPSARLRPVACALRLPPAFGLGQYKSKPRMPGSSRRHYLLRSFPSTRRSLTVKLASSNWKPRALRAQFIMHVLKECYRDSGAGTHGVAQFICDQSLGAEGGLLAHSWAT